MPKHISNTSPEWTAVSQSAASADGTATAALSAAYLGGRGSTTCTNNSPYWDYLSNNLSYVVRGQFLYLNGTITNYSGGELYPYSNPGATMFTIPTSSLPGLFTNYTSFTVTYVSQSVYTQATIQMTQVGTNYVFKFLSPSIAGPNATFQFQNIFMAP
jgi:hypothetical protein